MNNNNIIYTNINNNINNDIKFGNWRSRYIRNIK